MVLLRLYGKRGIALTAILGGLVNSTASAAELSSSLPAAGLLEKTVPAVLLTSVAMFVRNLILLGVFAPSAVKFAALPIFFMALVAGYFAFSARNNDTTIEELELHLTSPVSLKKVLSFGLLFLVIQIVATAAARWLGNGGVLFVSIIGGMVSSASTTAAAANMVTHGSVTALQAGMVTVLTSIASTTMNLPIIRRQIKDMTVVREIVLSTALQATVGIAAMIVESLVLSCS